MCHDLLQSYFLGNNTISQWLSSKLSDKQRKGFLGLKLGSKLQQSVKMGRLSKRNSFYKLELKK